MYMYAFEFLMDRSFDEKKNRYISSKTINNEWNLKCIWNGKHSRPEFLEIRRNTTAGDILVSGTYRLRHGQLWLRTGKFVQLIEDGFATTQVELDYNVGDSHLKEIDNTCFAVALSISVSNFPLQSLFELSRDFERLLHPEATVFADMNLKCENVSFSVHKNILSVRSPVFAAMFSTEMKEKQENEVDISDIRSDVLQTMLTYIYTGRTGELSVQSAGELLFAADKYQLQDLKRVCIYYLKSCVSVDNVLKSLVLGYLHDNDLQAFAMDFICNCCENFEVLEKTMDWKTLREERPSLAIDVLIGVIKTKDKK